MHVIKYVTKEELTSELVIEQFQPSDQGTYTCVARTVYNNRVETSSKIGEALCVFSEDRSIPFEILTDHQITVILLKIDFLE